jgi:hypothetical protein
VVLLVCFLIMFVVILGLVVVCLVIGVGSCLGLIWSGSLG